MKTSFLSIQEYNTTNCHLMVTYRRLLKDQKKKRFFNYIRYYAEKKKDLRKRYQEYSSITQKKTKSLFFSEWLHQYDNEYNIKEFTTKRSTKIILTWIQTCQHQVKINKLLAQFQAQHKHNLKQNAFIELV